MVDVSYFDSCIWLNLFKKEGDASKGVPYWKLAKEYIEKVKEENTIIIVSTIVLKELSFKLGVKFDEVMKFFKESDFIKIIKTSPEDYNLARIYEQEHGLISFYDYLHVAICRRLNIQLITRDSDLMEFAGTKIKVHKPEDLLG